MPTSAIGSQIQLIFQPKFPTFTPDQLDKALKDKGFQIAVGQAASPQGQAVAVQIFSKGNLVVFLLPNPPPSPPQLVFQILNTINLNSAIGETSIMNDITQILTKLNIVPEVIAAISFSCTTMIQARNDPTKGLASIVKDGFLEKLSRELQMDSLNITALRFGTAFPIELEKKGFQINLEPLATNPKGQFFLNIAFKTDTESEFNSFIRKFGEDFIESIRKGVSE